MIKINGKESLATPVLVPILPSRMVASRNRRQDLPVDLNIATLTRLFVVNSVFMGAGIWGIGPFNLIFFVIKFSVFLNMKYIIICFIVRTEGSVHYYYIFHAPSPELIPKHTTVRGIPVLELSRRLLTVRYPPYRRSAFFF